MDYEEKNIGLIGAGTMGRGLGKNILEAGYTLIIYDINPENSLVLENLGAQPASSVADLAGDCGIIITCLPSIESIIEVYEGAEGLIPNVGKGTVIVDCAGATCSILLLPKDTAPKAPSG